MRRAWDSYGTRLRTILNDLKEQDGKWTPDEFMMHMREYKRLNPRTIQGRLAQLAFMERHPVFPVQTHKGPWALVNSFWLYVQHREKVEEAQPGALRNDHKAVRTLGDFLAIPHQVWPTAPAELMTDERFIPTPEQVHDLLQANYTPRPKVSYENALVKGLLVFDFLIGPRFPSEPHALQLADLDCARHRIVITEPKKTGRRRTLRIEPTWICCSPRHPSLANYLVWRRKVDPERQQKAFFLQANGKPFSSKDTLRNYLNEMVKPKFPWFNPYLGRHWSCTARLIDWDFDYNRVADWHGHESVNMTRREYEHNTRLLKAEFGGEWIARTGRKTNRRPKNGVSVSKSEEK